MADKNTIKPSGSGRKPAQDGRRAQTDRGTSAAPLSAVFDGQCTLEIADLEAPPLGDRFPLRSDIVFSPARDAVTLRELDEITTPRYETDLGPARVKNATTVRLSSAVAGELSRDGHVSIPVVLRFDHSFDGSQI